MTSVVLLVLALSPEPFQLDWRAPQSCAPKPDVEAITGGTKGRAEVEIRDVGDGWDVTVLFFEPYEGLRRVKARSCEEGSRVGALLVQLGSRGALTAALPGPAPEPAALPPPSPPAPIHFSLHAGAALDVGTSPTVDPRLALTANLLVGVFRLALDGRFGFPLQVPGTQASVARTGEGQVAACVDFAWRALSGGPCAAAALSSWRIVHGGRAAQTFMVAVGPQVRAALRLVSGLELGTVLGVRFNLRRPQPFDDVGPVFTTPLVAGDFQLTVGWRW